MKAVILTGSRGTAPFPLANYYTKLELPLANQPLIAHHLNFLKKSKISEVAVISSVSKNLMVKKYKHYLRPEINISFFEETKARGTAGCLKELEKFIGSSNFLVLSPNSFIEKLDLSEIVKFHFSRKAGVTMLVEESNGEKEALENVQVDRDGNIKKIHILHSSRDNRRPLIPVGIYIFSPSVLLWINNEGYMDINEQLIPKLVSKGMPVHAYKTKGNIRKIDSLSKYFQLNRDILSNEYMNESGYSHSKTEIMERVWVGKNFKISSSTYLIGPVVIGDNCTIGDGSQIIGPVCIGDGSYIDRNVLIRESILWEEVHVMNLSRIENSFVGERSLIRKGENVQNAVVLQDKKCKRNNNFFSVFKQDTSNVIVNKSSLWSPVFNQMKFEAYQTSKRLLDIILSSIGLLFCLPLFLIIAFVIKIGSPGPVFFLQRRCGKKGKEFKMYKFRTMVEEAEQLQESIRHHNNVDGPMFKMEEDPRVTNVGRFLRNKNLDELPQLLNVLKGEMSLVGPRPLKMEEMAFNPSWRDLRLRVTPGITGLWQISGKKDVSFDGWIMYDAKYVMNHSLWLDFKILLKTFVVISRP